MLSIEIDVETLQKQLKRDLDTVRLKYLPAAVKPSLNRVGNSVRANWTKTIAQLAKIKLGLVKRRSNNSPRDNGWTRIISVNTATIPLAVTGVKGRPITGNRKGGGVRSAGRHIPDGFVGKAWLGKLSKTYYQRAGERRLKEIRIHIKDYADGSAQGAAIDAIMKHWSNRLRHELERRVNSHMKRAGR